MYSDLIINKVIGAKIVTDILRICNTYHIHPDLYGIEDTYYRLTSGNGSGVNAETSLFSSSNPVEDISTYFEPKNSLSDIGKSLSLSSDNLVDIIKSNYNKQMIVPVINELNAEVYAGAFSLESEFKCYLISGSMSCMFLNDKGSVIFLNRNHHSEKLFGLSLAGAKEISIDETIKLLAEYSKARYKFPCRVYFVGKFGDFIDSIETRLSFYTNQDKTFRFRQDINRYTLEYCSVDNSNYNSVGVNKFSRRKEHWNRK